MKGRVNTGGGGLNASVILLEAPTGSTATCTKGDKVKTAAEKNGVWTFRGIEIGEWTVKVTKDGQSASQVVNVTQFDVYRVTLAYFNATIETTFPTDCASVTCTKDDIILSVPSGNLPDGSYTFNIPETGEWVLYCTNGVDSDTKTISVTEEKAYSATLSFLLWLYNSGDECEDITGGWGAVRLKVTRNEDSINIVPTEPYTGNAGLLYTNNLIDLTNIKNLHINAFNNSDVDAYLPLEVAPTQETPSGVIAFVNVPKRQTATVSMDVTGITGEYYVRISTMWNPDSGDKGNGTIYKIWGE